MLSFEFTSEDMNRWMKELNPVPKDTTLVVPMHPTGYKLLLLWEKYGRRPNKKRNRNV